MTGSFDDDCIGQSNLLTKSSLTPKDPSSNTGCMLEHHMTLQRVQDGLWYFPHIGCTTCSLVH